MPLSNLVMLQKQYKHNILNLSPTQHKLKTKTLKNIAFSEKHHIIQLNRTNSPLKD